MPGRLTHTMPNCLVWMIYPPTLVFSCLSNWPCPICSFIVSCLVCLFMFITCCSSTSLLIIIPYSTIVCFDTLIAWFWTTIIYFDTIVINHSSLFLELVYVTCSYVITSSCTFILSVYFPLSFIPSFPTISLLSILMLNSLSITYLWFCLYSNYSYCH